MKDYVADEVKGFFSEGDLFTQVDKLSGQIYRALEARRTLRVTLGGRGYFAKIHFGVGWTEIVKNLLQGRLPVLGARNEWLALNRLREVGVPSMTPVVFCERGRNPASRHSAILTEALESKVTLEDFECDDPVVRRKLIREVAGMSRKMHAAGVNHRDFYLCHFLMDEGSSDAPQLHLIDLHRAQIRAQVPLRWRVKDLGGLLFSAFEKNLTRRDLLRFLRVYFNQPLREILDKEGPLLEKVVKRAVQLYLQDHDALPADVKRILSQA